VTATVTVAVDVAASAGAAVAANAIAAQNGAVSTRMRIGVAGDHPGSESDKASPCLPL
jgi:hypothetical protein